MRVPAIVGKDAAFVVLLGEHLAGSYYNPQLHCSVRVDHHERVVYLNPEFNPEYIGYELNMLKWLALPCLVEPLGAAGRWTIRYVPASELRPFLGPTPPYYDDTLLRVTLDVAEETP